MIQSEQDPKMLDAAQYAISKIKKEIKKKRERDKQWLSASQIHSNLK